jgi:tRNA threonylcarbamoyladenosine biosynthesis protein TsaE
MTIELRSETADDTRAIGRSLADVYRAGDTTILTGELGAGKTTLVQGVAQGLGSEDPVASPTFTLVREYGGGRLDVIHVDVYRLDRVQDVVDLGLDELLEAGGAVLLVEWGDAVGAVLPSERLQVELTEPDPGSDARRIVLSAVGPGWAERWERLEHGVAAWAASG